MVNTKNYTNIQINNKRLLGKIKINFVAALFLKNVVVSFKL